MIFIGIVISHPKGCNIFWCKNCKPNIICFLCCSCFSCSCFMITTILTYPFTDDTLQHLSHCPSSLFSKDLCLLRFCRSNYFSFTVFYSRHDMRFCHCSLVTKDRISLCYL